MRDVSECSVEEIIEDLVMRQCGVLICLGDWEESFLGPSDSVYVQINFQCPDEVRGGYGTDEPIGDAHGTVLIDTLRLAYEDAMRHMPACEDDQ